jgi:hypothetical protein
MAESLLDGISWGLVMVAALIFGFALVESFS